MQSWKACVLLKNISSIVDINLHEGKCRNILKCTNESVNFALRRALSFLMGEQVACGKGSHGLLLAS